MQVRQWADTIIGFTYSLTYLSVARSARVSGCDRLTAICDHQLFTKWPAAVHAAANFRWTEFVQLWTQGTRTKL